MVQDARPKRHEAGALQRAENLAAARTNDERVAALLPELDPYVQEADANPERRDNGCMIYRQGDV